MVGDSRLSPLAGVLLSSGFTRAWPAPYQTLIYWKYPKMGVWEEGVIQAAVLPQHKGGRAWLGAGLKWGTPQLHCPPPSQFCRCSVQGLFVRKG